ncbi:5-formyltetrahydrofolate cyclo-ligase [Paractinoplanes rishiriensis]|uniref:5-formyltetrahydrofolate cyclo-ligase n=1 Tax=Paractinoplanes rishiriensis TaxID=1050105 RepID=UPI001941E113|nr:5-formyltetrahydrofolate cyclo-ligase [Actinoplanes rishiriensis]
MSDLTDDAEGSRAAKIALRSRLITARRHLLPATRLAFADQLQGQIQALVRREHPSTIAAYVPVGTEPGGANLPDVLAVHARVLLPVLRDDDDLDWAGYDGELSPGPRGLLEPPGPRLGADAIRSADLVLVPALAVDRRGRRMGRGGGSYDRVLARLDGAAPTVALLHDGELLDEVPAEPHDRPVDAVILPGGTVTLNPAAEWTK